LLREWKERREREHEELLALREWRAAQQSRIWAQREMLAEYRKKLLLEAWGAERDPAQPLQ
jgi:hypothetical protein